MFSMKGISFGDAKYSSRDRGALSDKCCCRIQVLDEFVAISLVMLTTIIGLEKSVFSQLTGYSETALGLINLS